MRFRTTERVQVESSERVLAVLEQRLRAMVSDVARDGNRITLLGLGPSSRSINRHDTTVIDVWAEDGVTTIGADVTFQASAFLGATGQEEIMRLKLERLFEETKEQLDFESRHDVARIARMEALVGGGSSASRRVADEPHDTPQQSSDSPVAEKEFSPVEHSPVEDEISGAQKEDTAAEVSVAALPAMPETSTRVEGVSAASRMADPVDDVEEEEPIDDSYDPDNSYDLQDEDEERSNRWVLWAVFAACVAAALPFGLHYFSMLREAKEAPAVVTKPQPVAEPAKPVTAAEPADLLRQWELAMRSRDAAAQAAFYAVPVERYFLRSNVTKAQVEADKQQQIDSRRGIWTVKMEKVKINRNADNAATVSLVKHYMQQEDGKPVKEWFVPSQLKLKNEYGVWWITSERNLFAAPLRVTPDAP